MDVGQSTANALYQQAVAGTFTLEKDAAEKAAACFQRLADDTLQSLVKQTDKLGRHDGFGGFVSAQQLQNGFANKGVLLSQVLTGMQEAAYRMAAAYLLAGGQLAAADEMSKRAITAAQSGLEG
jgi:hypothetical protein